MSGTYFIKFGKVYQEEEDLGLYYECEKPYLKMNKKKLKRTRLEIYVSKKRLDWECESISEDV